MSGLGLDLFWNPDRGDNYCTATEEGRQSARDAGYAWIRREGYTFPGSEPGVKPLKLFWSADRQDNMTVATPEAERDALAAGYDFVRVEGYVKANSEPNTLPLKLYYGKTRGDYFLTATGLGETAALEAGYEFVRIEGYGAFEPFTRSAKVRSEVGAVIPQDGVMETTVTVDRNGALQAFTETTNYAKFWGFQGGVLVFFSDAQGTTISGYNVKREPYGVQGTFYGFSSRRDPWNAQIPVGDVNRIEHVHIFHYLVGIQLQREIQRITELITASAGAVGAVGGIVAQIKAMGGRGQ
ncbi:hypothetical protein [Paracoccus niistensis]|uniref:DUF5648 domain-containing protein n=1 Tax=Paracoccus niistensis TaxID=632935 RepID=A0ABV6I4N2_9RHOB